MEADRRCRPAGVHRLPRLYPIPHDRQMDRSGDVGLEQKRKARKEPFGNFLASSEVQRLPEEGGSDRKRVVLILYTNLVFGCSVDVLSLQLHPIREVITGKADPGLVVLNQA
jgi:hypothetical protein